MKFSKTHISIPALAIMLAATAAPAWAREAAAAPAGATQDEPAAQADDQSDGEIVVTAQFREQNLQDTPLAITAVNAEMLEARSQTDISQVANQAPSVTLKPQGAAFGPSLGANIRGVGQFDFNPALEPGVGFYVDDVYYATLTGSILDLLDLERVEIQRGPQGTLAGRNSIGGAVKLFSKRPEGTNSGYVSAAYGSRNRVDLRASGDFNLAEGLDVRIAGVAKKQEGYVKRLDFGCVYPAGGAATFTRPYSVPAVAGPDVPQTLLVNPVGGVPAKTNRPDCLIANEGQVNFVALRGQLRYRPTDTIDINIIADYTDDDRVAAGSVLLLRSYPSGNVATPRYPLPLIRRSGLPRPRTMRPHRRRGATSTRSPLPTRFCPMTIASSAAPIATSAATTCPPRAITGPRPATGGFASRAGASRASSNGRWPMRCSSFRSPPCANTRPISRTTMMSRRWRTASAMAR
ncbi:MAG: TonB-dependent receptor [Sphingomonas sp.]